MKRALIVTSILILMAAGIGAQSLGTGITVFVPESLYQGEDGSVSLETGFDSSIGLGNLLSLPFGLTYIKVNGLSPAESDQAWYAADALLLHLMVQIRVDLGPVFLKAYGGGAASWLMSHKPYAQSIEAYYLSQAGGGIDDVQLSGISDDFRWGFGWQAGGGFGVKIDPIEIQVDATYRSIGHQGTLTADYSEITGGSAATSSLSESIALFLRGISIGLGGSFAF
jgi:hypothetical protein